MISFHPLPTPLTRVEGFRSGEGRGGHPDPTPYPGWGLGKGCKRVHMCARPYMDRHIFYNHKIAILAFVSFCFCIIFLAAFPFPSRMGQGPYRLVRVSYIATYIGANLKHDVTNRNVVSLYRIRRIGESSRIVQVCLKQSKVLRM